MAKTQEELNQLKVEYEALNNKLKELTQEELSIVTGGFFPDEHNIMTITGDFTGNHADGTGGDGVFFIGRHNIREPLVGNVNIPDPTDEQIIK